MKLEEPKGDGAMDDLKLCCQNAPEDPKSWYDFCAAAFGGDAALARYFQTSWELDPHRKENRILTLRRPDGTLLSTLTVISRTVLLDGCPVKAGGIATVCTRKDQQGKGLAGHLLREALARMTEQGDAIALLGTAIPDYYRKFGWEPLASRFSAWTAEPVSPPPGVRLRPLDPEDWDAAAAGLYRAESARARRNGMVLRLQETVWGGWLAQKGCRWFLTEDAAGPRAYAAGADSDGVLELRELGCREDAEGDLSSLISALCGGVRREVVGPPGPYLPPQAVETPVHGLMLRLLRPLTLNGRTFADTAALIRHLETSPIPFAYSENDSF